MLGTETKENSLTGKTVQNFVTSPSLWYDSVRKVLLFLWWVQPVGTQVGPLQIKLKLPLCLIKHWVLKAYGGM